MCVFVCFPLGGWFWLLAHSRSSPLIFSELTVVMVGLAQSAWLFYKYFVSVAVGNHTHPSKLPSVKLSWLRRLSI